MQVIERDSESYSKNQVSCAIVLIHHGLHGFHKVNTDLMMANLS